MVDTAKAAEQLSLGKLSKSIAILGPKNLSDRYNFDIIAENLQDKKDNLTRFLLVKR
jgi:prephenate dehydratase